MKVEDEKCAEYMEGIFLYRLVNELVFYLLPISYKSGKTLQEEYSSDNGR